MSIKITESTNKLTSFEEELLAVYHESGLQELKDREARETVIIDRHKKRLDKKIKRIANEVRKDILRCAAQGYEVYEYFPIFREETWDALASELRKDKFHISEVPFGMVIRWSFKILEAIQKSTEEKI